MPVPRPTSNETAISGQYRPSMLVYLRLMLVAHLLVCTMHNVMQDLAVVRDGQLCSLTTSRDVHIWLCGFPQAVFRPLKINGRAIHIYRSTTPSVLPHSQTSSSSLSGRPQ